MVLMDVGGWFHDTVLSGSLLLALAVAAVAGLVSFFSPCVVPLLPGYLSYATGLSGADLESAGRGRMLVGRIACSCGRHRTWRCECGASPERPAPSLSPQKSGR